MRWMSLTTASVVLLVASIGCVDLGLQQLFPAGSPFVLGGTATIVDNGGPCPVWVGDNGITYHLFQDPLLSNEVFDRITAPGTSSRLLLVTREDLAVACRVGTIVVVQEVLEVVE